MTAAPFAARDKLQADIHALIQGFEQQFPGYAVRAVALYHNHALGWFREVCSVRVEVELS